MASHAETSCQSTYIPLSPFYVVARFSDTMSNGIETDCKSTYSHTHTHTQHAYKIQTNEMYNVHPIKIKLSFQQYLTLHLSAALSVSP